ncbi:MAG: hypothetical protein ABL949_12995 [Fimbriimonadaceae bacterium]
MVSLLLGMCLAGQGVQGNTIYLGDPSLASTRLQIFEATEKLGDSKKSPKLFGDPPTAFLFDWLCGGYGRINPDKNPNYNLRFRVFSQTRKETGDVAVLVTRMLLRIWDLNVRKLKIDHSNEFNSQIVDVYLCWGGTPGGEHMFSTEIENTYQKKVNTIYIYDLESFKDPVEMAREVAHEYGHATLNAIGGFKEPEEWGNGQLGEKLYLRWLSEEISDKRLEPIDAMGAFSGPLNAWVKKNVTPLVERCRDNGPVFSLLEGTGQGAMDACNGLILYAETIFPSDVFAQSLKNMVGETEAKYYPRALLDAATATSACAIRIPPAWKGKSLWLPTGAEGTVKSGTIIRRQGDWSLVKPGPAGVLSIVKAKGLRLGNNHRD